VNDKRKIMTELAVSWMSSMNASASNLNDRIKYFEKAADEIIKRSELEKEGGEAIRKIEE
jgi:hypothetical protein